MGDIPTLMVLWFLNQISSGGVRRIMFEVLKSLLMAMSGMSLDCRPCATIDVVIISSRMTIMGNFLIMCSLSILTQFSISNCMEHFNVKS